MEKNENNKPAQVDDDYDDIDLAEIEGHDFDTTLQEVKFKIKGEGYILREMPGTLRDAWQKQLFEEYMVREGDVMVTKKHEGLYAILLIRSIFREATGEPMEFAFACSLPSRLQTNLYLAARKISKLDVKRAKKEAAKNS